MARPRLPDEVKKQRGTYRPGREALRAPETPRNDPDGVYAEFDALVAEASAEGRLDGFRLVHKAALACHKNGYDVPFHALPYLMALSAAEQNASTADERQALRDEQMKIYADVKEWRRKTDFYVED